MNRTLKGILFVTADVIVVIVTLIVFFLGLPYPKTAIDFSALFFVLISEAVLFCGSLLTGLVVKNKLFLNAGLLSTLVVYWFVTVLVAVFYRPVFGNHVGGLITMQIIVMALALLSVIGILLAASHLRESQGDEGEVNLLDSCQDTVFRMENEEKFKAFSKQLNELYEVLKFSDKTENLPFKETEISEQIGFLAGISGEIKEDEFEKMITHVISLIKERNRLVLQSKRGGY